MHSKKTSRWYGVGFFSVVILCVSGFVHAEPTAFTDGVGSLSWDAARDELLTMPKEVRPLMTQEQMARFIGNVLVDRRIAEAAQRAGIAELPQVTANIRRATREIMVRAWIDSELARAESSLPDLSALARERYLAERAKYVVPEMIRTSHILLEVSAEKPDRDEMSVKNKITSLREQLREGADFEVLAKEYSDDLGSKRRGGELGWTEKGRFVPPFEAAAYALKPGEISEPVRTRFGYHIIKLHEKREARQQGFDEVKASIIAALRKDMLANKREELLKPFQGRQPIELDEATLDALKKP